jgi:phosphoribosylamine--glycine ligase / phosphoribosylformylglycinamidine cyclo-ligase
MSSSGLHSNGFSLVRRILSTTSLTYSSPCPWDGQTTLGRHILEPTRIYIKQVLPVAQAGLLKGMSHITGGGFTENIPRVLPSNMGCFVDASTWQRPELFSFLQAQGRVEPLEMARTFNNGIGMVLVVDPMNEDAVVKMLRDAGTAEIYHIGEVIERPGVEMRHLECWS